MIDQVEIQLVLLADGVGAEWALKTVILLVVLLVVCQGAVSLEIARGAVKNRFLSGTVSGSVDLLVGLPECQFQFQPGFLSGTKKGINID